MKELGKSITVLILIGIILCIFGWTQSFSFEAEASVYYEVLINTTIRSYIFMCTGIALIIISIFFNKVIEIINKEIVTLTNKCSELERCIDRLNTNKDTNNY